MHSGGESKFVSLSFFKGVGLGFGPLPAPPPPQHTLPEAHMMAQQMLCLSPGNSFVDPPIIGIKSYYHLIHISIKFLDPPTSIINEHQ